MDGDAEFVLLINPDVQAAVRKLRGRARSVPRPARGRGRRTARQYRRNVAAELHLCAAAIRPDLRGRGPRGAVPELATAAPVPNAGLGPPRCSAGGCGEWCLHLPSPRRDRRCGLVRRALLRLLRGDRLADPGEAAWLADGLRAHRRGGSRFDRQLARRSLPTQPAASREPASLRPKALRGDDDRHSFARHCSESTRHASPATRSPAEPTRERRRRTASASTSRCARPGPRNQMEVSYTCSLDRVDAADWQRLAERAGHVFATREWLLTWWRHYGKAHRQLTGLARSRRGTGRDRAAV